MKRFEQLDGLRGLAAIFVLAFHYLHEYPSRFGHGLINEQVILGKYGVDLFFVISGFVILFSVEKQGVKDFAVSRFCRLFPTYWTGCIFTFGVMSFSQLDLSHGFENFLVNLTMLQAFLGYEHVDGSYWTLTYELVFYCYAFSIFGFNRDNFNKKCLFLISVQIFIVLFERYYEVPHFLIAGTLSHYFHLFMLGMIINKKDELKRKQYVILLIFLGFASFIINGIEGTIVFLFCYVLVSNAANGKLKLLSSRVFVYLGGMSYSLYIIHQYVGYHILKVLESNNFEQLFSVFATTILMFIVSGVIYELIDCRLSPKLKKTINKALK
ncbi:acyltransferase family protein [Vibrio parahaemolyticus]|uniref:Acyltransferase 3 n=1 Tax=Vibrio parahaemolyticus TaxID=670 RepID=A0A5P4SC41_VIBPH|nr:acyltransferase [Vibrio parahaemolyticus]EJE4554113.1 acyltransferase [Vibrio parahaemolyticus]QFC18371.1 acyltransferase 3 [Vibrio parahaemolyticus]QOS16125.1 hypothetical protein VP33_00011 [Vibrio parahaemolyticus]HCH0377938.1 acyltransferase [Vibrio parahaemolyticus]HCH1503824.1 acyltransferase [Vibrio parahaemolyticus]